MQQVELSLEIEDMLPSFILRRVQVEKHEEYPNRLSNWRTKVRNVTPRHYFFHRHCHCSCSCHCSCHFPCLCPSLAIAIALVLVLVLVLVLILALALALATATAIVVVNFNFNIKKIIGASFKSNLKVIRCPFKSKIA